MSDTYARMEGPDKLCITIPSDLIRGQHKFEVYLHKAHEDGYITVGSPSLRPLTVDESLKQVGLEAPSPWSILLIVLCAFVLIMTVADWIQRGSKR